MICSALLLALSLAPQELATPVLLEAPLTLAVDQATAQANGLTTDRVWFKRPFVEPGNTPSEHPSNAGQPYFSALSAQAIPPWVVPGIEIDAFSTNVNYLAASPSGLIDKGAISYTFAGLAVSVVKEAGTTTVPPPVANSVFERHLGEPSGADLYEYMFPGSNQGNENKLVRAINETFVSLSTAGTDDPEITALDLYAAALTHPNGVVGALHGAFESVVFSVTQASANTGSVPPEWFQPKGGGQQYPIDGGSLIRVDWEETFAESGVWDWSDPYLFRTAEDMGLTGEVQGQPVTYDLTAVAWHSYVTPIDEHYLVFSSENPAYDPIMFDNIGPGVGAGTRAPLRAVVEVGSGSTEIRLVSTEMKLRLQVDKIDALSAFDPRIDITKIISVGDGTAATLSSRMFRDISYPGGNPDCDLVTGMMDPTGTVLSDTAVLLGRFPDAVPTVHAVLPWSAGTARYTIGDVPAILFGVPYQTQWVALLGSATVATSDWQSIDI